MARITICDLCKERMSDEESEHGVLSLLFGLEKDGTTKDDIHAEVCKTCHERLKACIEGPHALTMPQSIQKNTSPVRDAPVETFKNAFPERPTNAASPVGPTQEEKANREPTEELLEDEIHSVPSSVDLRKGSSDVRKLNRAIVSEKGKCPHHYKTFEEGAIKCADAPPGIRGPYANFRGCGKILGDNEL